MYVHRLPINGVPINRKSKMDSTEWVGLKWNYMRNGYHTQYFMARYAKYEVKFTLAFSLYPFLPYI